MLEACRKYIYSIRAKLSPAYLILILVTSSPIVVSLPLLSGRSLFGTRKLVKYLPKLCLFTTQSNIALPDILDASVKLVSYSQVVFLIPRPRRSSLLIRASLTFTVTLGSKYITSFQTAERKLQETTYFSGLLRISCPQAFQMVSLASLYWFL